MKLNSLIKDFRFDKRMIDWGVRYKAITYQEYEDYLKSLEDLSNKKDSLTDTSQESEDPEKK